MGLFSRIGDLFRGGAGRLVRKAEEGDPALMLEALRSDIDRSESEYERRLIDLQASAEYENLSIRAAARKVAAVEGRIATARSTRDKDLLVELLIQKERLENDIINMTRTYNTILDNIARFKDEFRTFEVNMRYRLDEIRQLKAGLRVANMTRPRSALSPVKIREMENRLDHAREVIDAKVAMASAVSAVSQQSLEYRLAKLDATDALARATRKAEELLGEGTAEQSQ